MSSIALPPIISPPKITILYDNTKSDNPCLKEGFGFSCVVDIGAEKILFDTGGDSKAFFSNIKMLSLDLKSITHVVFSHKHWDHTSGFSTLLPMLSKRAKLFIPDRFSSKMERSIPAGFAFRKVSDLSQIAYNVFSLVMTGPYWLTTIREQSLILRTAKGLVIITGCAHPGIDSIVKRVIERFSDPIHLVVGGFHMKRSSAKTCNRVIRSLLDSHVEKVAPCHCAGAKAIHMFSDSYKENFIRVATGTEIDII